ncbi:MAG: hypothetical protein ACR2P4_08805 [Gammaproteobacteria bacterium]
MAVIGDNNDKKANPQNSGGTAQAGGDAPVFVKNLGDYFNHLGSHSPDADFNLLAKSGCFVGFALLYALAFLVAGWVGLLFPQTYQAWLDFCLPLTEYVGGLTPRAGRIAGELIAGGYPERADDALHGIAMTRVLLFPAVVLLLLLMFDVLVKTPRVAVSCTRRTHMLIWLVVFPLCLAGVFLAYLTEVAFGEDFGPTSPFVSLANYHSGNFAMVTEVLLWSLICVLTMGCVLMFWKLCRTRFNIVKQPPEYKK